LGQFARARQEFESYLQLAPNAPDAEQVRKHLKKIGAGQNKK
jgi:regulator of sirC expression with transglutaminase-like and TPR domain